MAAAVADATPAATAETAVGNSVRNLVGEPVSRPAQVSCRIDQIQEAPFLWPMRRSLYLAVTS